MANQRRTAALFLLSSLLLAGCGTSFPSDPTGTLQKVKEGTLRVGASENGDWVDLPDSTGGDVEGTEAELVRRFAASLGAEVEWVPGTEHVLAEELKHGGLDLVIGGLDDKTPWATHAGLTLPYTESRDSRGSLHKHVMLAPLGENAFLLQLDKFLMETAGAK